MFAPFKKDSYRREPDGYERYIGNWVDAPWLPEALVHEKTFLNRYNPLNYKLIKDEYENKDNKDNEYTCTEHFGSISETQVISTILCVLFVFLLLFPEVWRNVF